MDRYSPWCDLSIIWARDIADNQVKGFIVQNRLQRREDRAQDRAQGGAEQTDYAEGRTATGGQSPAGRQLLPRQRARAADDPLHGGWASTGVQRGAFEATLTKQSLICPTYGIL